MHSIVSQVNNNVLLVHRIFRRPLPDLDGYEAPSVVSKQPACTASLAALLEAEGSVWDSGPSGSDEDNVIT